MKRYIIIGAGAAGISAAEAIRCHDPLGEIVILTEDPYGYYSRPGLAYFLTGEIPEKSLFPFSKADFQRLKLTLRRGRALQIETGRQEILLEDGARLPYDRALLATGSMAAKITTPGADLEGVVKLDNMEDAQRILKLARRARQAVVVGGGITALEIAEGLVSRRVRTHYFLRGDRYWGNVLDETESRIVESLLKEEGVQIHYHTELAEITGASGRVSGVLTQDGRHIPCQIVAVAIGVKPRAELALRSGLAVERGVLVNDTLQTSDPLIYAAGDVAQAYDPATGKTVLDTLWGPALQQGHVAGLNLAGIPTSYRKEFAFNVTRLAGLTTTIIGGVGRGEDQDLLGIARGDSETWRQFPDAIAAQSDFEVNRLRMMVGRRSILGAVVMGDQTLSQAIQYLVNRQVDILPVRERLLSANGSLGDVVAEFWARWKEAYAASSKT